MVQRNGSANQNDRNPLQRSTRWLFALGTRPRKRALMSQFVWLDYSERERRKMLDIVDLFREHDTRDELGIGSTAQNRCRATSRFEPAITKLNVNCCMH